MRKLTFGFVFFLVGFRRATGGGSRLVVCRYGGGRGRRWLAGAGRRALLAGPTDHDFRWRYNDNNNNYDDVVLVSLHLNSRRRQHHARNRRGISSRIRVHRRSWRIDRSFGLTWRWGYLYYSRRCTTVREYGMRLYNRQNVIRITRLDHDLRAPVHRAFSSPVELLRNWHSETIYNISRCTVYHRGGAVQ